MRLPVCLLVTNIVLPQPSSRPLPVEGYEPVYLNAQLQHLHPNAKLQHLSNFASVPPAGHGFVHVKVYFCMDGTRLSQASPGRLMALSVRFGFQLYGTQVLSRVRGCVREGWRCRLDADGALDILLILKVPSFELDRVESWHGLQN